MSSARKDTTPKNKNRVLSKRNIQKTKRKNSPNLKITEEVIDSIKELEKKAEGKKSKDKKDEDRHRLFNMQIVDTAKVSERKNRRYNQ